MLATSNPFTTDYRILFFSSSFLSWIFHMSKRGKVKTKQEKQNRFFLTHLSFFLRTKRKRKERWTQKNSTSIFFPLMFLKCLIVLFFLFRYWAIHSFFLSKNSIFFSFLFFFPTLPKVSDGIPRQFFCFLNHRFFFSLNYFRLEQEQTNLCRVTRVFFWSKKNLSTVVALV